MLIFGIFFTARYTSISRDPQNRLKVAYQYMFKMTYHLRLLILRIQTLNRFGSKYILPVGNRQLINVFIDTKNITKGV